MSKIVFVSNISDRISSFVTASIAAAHSLDMDFYQVANWEGGEKSQIEADQKTYDIKIKSVSFSRNPLALKNISAYKDLVSLIKQENIDYIHCNTPTGGLVGRLAGKKCKVKKVIYQAHGFHFYKGSPKKNWLIYYTVEKLLARFTDALITINREDYEAAKRFKLKNGGKVFFVHGVGIDTAAYTPSAETRASKRAELGLGEEDFCVVSVGRLDANKNNETLIRAIGKLENKNVRLIICGDGEQRERLTDLMAELGVADRVTLLGNRNDMAEIYCAVDALAMASFREGLSRTLMEAMASGLPCVASKIRGNVDLIEDGVGGYLRAPNDVDGFAEAISKLASDAELCAKMREINLETVKSYDVSVVEKEIREIYREVLAEN